MNIEISNITNSKITINAGIKEPEYVFFWGGIYSNWYKCTVVEGDVTYNCTEQYMMHKKALLFNDEETALKIIRTKNPRDQKALGRKVSNFNSKIWDENKYKIVKDGCRLKFTQNPKLLEELLSNKGKQFVEASPYDRIWGIGYDERNALKNKDNWGENLLGKILTELSNELS